MKILNTTFRTKTIDASTPAYIRVAGGIMVVLTLLFAQGAQAQETAVTLSAGILTVTDINGGSSNDNLSVSFSAGTYTITDMGGLIISTAIAGATGSGTATVTVPNTGVTGINIQTLAGNDLITILSVDNLTNDFTINAGSGNDDVYITGATISLTGNGNDVNIEAERIVMNGTTPSISVTGTGVINIKANEGVSTYSQARIAFSNFSLSAEDGNITLLGVSYGTFNGDVAVLLTGTTSEIVTTGAGNISISGEAPALTFIVVGISIDGASVRAEGTGNITFTGKSQRTSGVRFDEDSGGNADLSSIDGDITINGETSGPNFGIWLRSNALIETTGSGDIFLNGTGLPSNSLGIQFGLTNIMVKASGSGNIQTMGNGGFRDIRFAGGTIGDAAGTGNITFIANDYDLAYSSSTIQGAGNLFFEPLTGSATIGLGAASGTPSIPNSIINQIQPGFISITIGDDTKTSVVLVHGPNFSAANTSVILEGTTIRDVNDAGTDITSTSVTGDGNLSPGASPGIFAVSGNYTFANSSTFTVEIDDAGTAGTDYDQLDATGAVTIGSTVTLSLDIDPGYMPTAGDEFIIVKSGSGLSGTFDGLMEGSIATNIDGLDFIISYAGGDGNDVVLKAPLPAAALSFDGVNDHVNLPFLFDPSATSFTAEAWVKPTLVDGNAHIFVQQNDGTGTGRTFLAIGSANKFYTFLGGSSLSGTTTVSANTWYHVAVTWDGAMLNLYVNGVEEASTSASIVNSDGTMILGTGKSGVLPYQGAMDEVRFWTRALCKEELLNNMNCELTGSETGLLAYYQFNQGLDGVPNPTETTLQEFSNTYDGTLTSFALIGPTSNWVEPGAVTTGVSCSAFAIANYDPAACACELGYYATLDGNGNITACTICPPGTYCPDGINQYDCAVGYFQASAGAIQCNACPPGKYQSNSGAVECLNCDVGKYNPNSAAVSCQDCPQGTYNDSQGQIVCETCEPGSVATTTGSAACVDCGDPVFSSTCPLTPETVNADPGTCSASVTLAVPTLNEDCTRNHALNFGGASDRVSIGNLGTVTDWTIETWFKPNGLNNYENIFHSYDGNGNVGVRVEISANFGLGHLYFFINTSAFTIVPLSGSLTDDWHHLAIVGDKTNSKVYAYLDGVKIIDGASHTNWPASFPDFVIGRGYSTTLPERDFNGAVDEFRIWNYARTEAEIQTTKNLEINATYSGLISYYDFNQGIACCNNTGLTTLPDGMGVNDGTLTNFTLASGCTSNWVAGAPVLGDPLTLTNDVTGNCSSASGTYPVGMTTVTWTATGANGEAATCVQTVTVEDNEDPTITCPANITVTNDPGVCTANVTVPAPVTDDNCAGNGLDFDGINDRVDLGAMSFYGNSFTVEGWFKSQDASGGATLFTTLNANGSAIDVQQTGASLRFVVRNPPANSGGLAIFGTTAVFDGNLHHFAAVKGDDDRLRLYIDGVLQATSTSTIGDFGPNTYTTYLGYHSPGSPRYFDGVMDDIRFWNVARTGTEIVNNMNAELGGTEPGLFAYYKLNEGAACGNNTGLTTAFDETVNGNHGTLASFDLTGGLTDPCQSNWTTGAPSVSISLTNSYNSQPTLTADFPLGTASVIWTATDPSGNSAECTMTVTVQSPEIRIEGNTMEIADGDNSPSATDDTDFGDQTVNSTTDRTFTIRNTGTTALNLSGNPIVAIGGASEFSVLTQPSGTSIAPNGSLTFVVRYAPTSPGSHTATVSIANNDCDENPYTFNVFGEVLCDISITSATPTAEICPGDNDGTITAIAVCISCTGGNADIRYSISPDPNSVSPQTSNVFSNLPDGAYAIMVADVNDPACTATQSGVIVAAGVDNQPPAISCPSNISVNNDPGQCCAEVMYTAPVGTDNCPGQSTAQTAGQASGFCFPVGVTTNTFEVTAANSQTASCSFTVTVTDNEPPAISCPSNISVDNDPGQCAATVYFAGGNSLIWTDDFISGFAPSNTQCQNWSDFLDLLTPGSYASVTIKGTFDPVGITITDPVAATQLANLLYTETAGSVTSGGHTWYVYKGCVASSCVDPSDGVELVLDAGNCSCGGAYTIRPHIGNENWGGVNTSTCTAPSQTMTLEFTISGGGGPVTIDDNCPGAILSQTAGLPDGSVFPVGMTLNTFEVTDGVNPPVSCSFTVTVTDNDPPAITCPSNVSVNNDPGVCEAFVSVPVPSITENCATMLGTGLDLDGVDEFISINPIGEFVNSNYTIEGWFNTSASGSNRVLLDGFVPATTDSYLVIMVMGVDGKLRFLHRQPPGVLGGENVYSLAPVNDGMWHHFAAVKSPDGKMRLYLDGVLQGTSAPTVTNFSGAPEIDLGRNHNNDWYFDGLIDEFRIWNVARTQQEIVCAMDQLVEVNASGLVAYYRMDEGSGNFATDYSSNSYTGTLQNMESADWVNSPKPGNNYSLSNDFNDSCNASDTYPVGTTTVIWTVTDASGNDSPCSMTVTVTDNEIPVINLLGDASLVICADETYTDAGATAMDNCDGDISANIMTGGSVNTSFAGVYMLTYDVMDAAGNPAVQVSRTVTVVDPQAASPGALTEMFCSPGSSTITVALGADSDAFNVSASLISGAASGYTASQTNLPGGSLLEPGAISNTGGVDAVIEYTITPYHYGPDGQNDNGGDDDCAGPETVVTITVKPEPVGANQSYPICSGGVLSIDLQGIINAFGNGVASSFSWVAANNSDVNGENTLPTAGGLINNLLTLVNPGNSPQIVVYTVTPTGLNGCPGAAFTVSVEVAPCDVTIIDPCTCLDNATTLENGQFSEIVEVTGPAGDTWTVVLAPGLYQMASLAPPAAPLPIAAGTPLAEGPPGVYTLAGKHIDALGYSISVTNGSVTLSTSNTCYYPNPSLSGLNEVYCSQDGAQIATVSAQLGDGSGPATVENILFELIRQSDNTVVASQSGVANTFNFNPSALAQGHYTLRVTFDGADDGVGHPGCEQTVEEDFEVRNVGCGVFPWNGN